MEWYELPSGLHISLKKYYFLCCTLVALLNFLPSEQSSCIAISKDSATMSIASFAYPYYSWISQEQVCIQIAPNKKQHCLPICSQNMKYAIKLVDNAEFSSLITAEISYDQILLNLDWQFRVKQILQHKVIGHFGVWKAVWSNSNLVVLSVYIERHRAVIYT